MSNDGSILVDVNALRIGHYVMLELGWLAHPFPSGSFKITAAKQIDTIAGLGLKHVHIDPSRSTPEVLTTSSVLPAADVTIDLSATHQELSDHQRRGVLLRAQQHSLVMCERRFTDSARLYRKVSQHVLTDASAAGSTALDLVQGYLKDIFAQEDLTIRLLGQIGADRSAMHAVNVTVVALLLGKAMGMERNALTELGLAAFLHDIGKVNVLERVRNLDENFSQAEVKLYQEHVAQSVVLGRGMGLSKSVLLAISQHHELADGNGFPMGLKGDGITLSGRILALVNRFDNLCNPARAGTALTPHEALSLLFAQHKSRFDGAVLSAFIRMMGVYPPGSVVQLIDDRHAMVVAVNSAKPLKPRVIVQEPGVGAGDGLVLDLEHAPNLGIRRSLKPSRLPPLALEFFSPPQRICYFFERLHNQTA